MSKVKDNNGFDRMRRIPKGIRNTFWLKKHNMCETPLYYVWQAMKQRCYNCNNTRYKNYGGRGIKVCDEWVDNFEEFCNWALFSGYETDLTLDRIDVNGNYCPENCRWITNEEQQNNTTKNVFLEYNGQKLTISQWAKKLNLDRNTLNGRLKKGWSIEKALITPVNDKYRKGKKNG